MSSKKEIARDFLGLTSKGHSRKAFKLYIGETFKHHNVYFKGDGDSLMLAMEESVKQHPDMVFEIQRVLEDHDLVAVHSRVQQNPNDMEIAIIHIMRFENDKIAELWDFGQVVPTEVINENGMF